MTILDSLGRSHSEAQFGGREKPAQPQFVEMLRRWTSVDEVAKERHHKPIEQVEAVERYSNGINLETRRDWEWRHLVRGWLLVHVHEVIQRVEAEESNVRGVRVVVRIREVRHYDLNEAAGARNAVDLRKQRQQLFHMLERVRAEDVIHAAVRQKLKRLIQVGNDVHAIKLHLIQRVKALARAWTATKINAQWLPLRNVFLNLRIEEPHPAQRLHQGASA